MAVVTNGSHGRGSGNLTPWQGILPLEQCYADWKGLKLLLCHDQKSKEELIPCVNKNEYPRSEYSRCSKGNHYLIKGLNTTASINPRRIFKVFGEFFKKTCQYPDTKRQCKGNIRDDESLIAV